MPREKDVLQLVSPGQTLAGVPAIGMFQRPVNAQDIADSGCVLLPTEPADHPLAAGDR